MVDATVDKQDVYRILRDSFPEICRKYFWDIHGAAAGRRWPSEAQVQQLAGKSGGLPILASTVLRFVGDPEVGDPEGQLKICLLFLGNFCTATTINPLHALDLLYHQIMVGIPPDILPVTMHILSLCLFYPPRGLLIDLCDQTLANLLKLDQTTFY